MEMCSETCGVVKLQILYKRNSKKMALKYSKLLHKTKSLLIENTSLKKRLNEIENKALNSTTTYKNTIANLLINETLDSNKIQENIDECDDLYIASMKVSKNVIKERDLFRDDLQRVKEENLVLKKWSASMENYLEELKSQLRTWNTAQLMTQNKRMIESDDKDVDQKGFKFTFLGGGAPEDLKTTLQSMISKGGTLLTCLVCTKSFDKALNPKAIQNMEAHVESLHVTGLKYDCSKCDKSFGSRNSMYTHKSKHHKVRKTVSSFKASN